MGKSQKDIKDMLMESGVDEKEIESLSEKFENDFEFYKNDKLKKERKNAPIDKIAGGILLFAGILISILTYVFSDQVYIVAYGAILVGAAIFIKGIIAENNKSK